MFWHGWLSMYQMKETLWKVAMLLEGAERCTEEWQQTLETLDTLDICDQQQKDDLWQWLVRAHTQTSTGGGGRKEITEKCKAALSSCVKSQTFILH
jgi:hypothetical protein